MDHTSSAAYEACVCMCIPQRQWKALTLTLTLTFGHWNGEDRWNAHSGPP